MTKHFQERRHRWAVELDGRLYGLPEKIAANSAPTILYRTRTLAQSTAKTLGGRAVKVRVKYEVIE